LVEWVIDGCRFPIDKLSILDIGSGSGCIAIALKRRLGKADVWSCDVSLDPLKVAQKNAASLGLDVNFFQLDFLNEEQRNKLPVFDIIVSNPPYVTDADAKTMRSNVLNFEPSKALFVPDDDPLVFYKAITDFGRTHLNPKGSIFIESNEAYGEQVAELFNSKGFSTVMKQDMQGKDRMIRAVHESG